MRFQKQRFKFRCIQKTSSSIPASNVFEHFVLQKNTHNFYLENKSRPLQLDRRATIDFWFEKLPPERKSKRARDQMRRLKYWKIENLRIKFYQTEKFSFARKKVFSLFLKRKHFHSKSSKNQSENLFVQVRMCETLWQSFENSNKIENFCV